MVSNIGFCPSCGNRSPHEIVGHFLNQSIPREFHTYVLAKCTTCSTGLFYRAVTRGDWIDDHFDLSKYELLWPAQPRLHDSVPQFVSKYYEEAVSIKLRSPNGFANQIRRALEGLCKDRGACHHVLADNLKELANRGEIPPILAEMTNVIRVLGNRGSHADEDEVESEYVNVIDDFFRAVIEYVYVAPYKVKEFKNQLAKIQQNNQQSGTNPQPV